jgi:hypothetical protein
MTLMLPLFFTGNIEVSYIDVSRPFGTRCFTVVFQLYCAVSLSATIGLLLPLLFLGTIVEGGSLLLLTSLSYCCMGV